MKHHVCYRQHLRRVARAQGIRGWEKRYKKLIEDPRNLVWIGWRCHAEHHNRARVLTLDLLPDSVFEFASETFGPDLAYSTLSRYYAGTDHRLQAFINQEVA